MLRLYPHKFEEIMIYYADNHCSYTEEHKPEHTYTFTGKCITTGKEHSVTIKGQDLFDYRCGKKAYIQDAFPYLTPQDREFLMTGNMFFLDFEDTE